MVYHRFPTNDAWCRDHGAIFVVRERDGRRELAATDWGYNAWGGKYPPFDLDNAIPRRMAEALGVPRFEVDMILEGGSIEVNGAGLLLTTTDCLLNPNRNPGRSREEIEQTLRDYLGVRKILWIRGELAGDDTDGHIDNIARFVGEDTVLAVVEDDPADENYEPLQENLARLREMTTVDGRPLRVETLPMPAPVYYGEHRLPASYANFYIGNTVILLPVYNDPNDAVAAEIIGRHFPDRTVVGIDCRELVWGLGAFHCLTQQVPAVR
ncbi:MAG: agmatine deiminase [Rhodothermaceae bacterium]|nr:MAG: agmatine deiminase [Rhodothermaceae bacterium]